jgi:prepilin-type processing-associated H-X9-DG protein
MKQFGLGMHNYHDTHKAFPIGHMFRGIFDADSNDADGGSGFGWGSALLPYIEQQNIYSQFNLSLPITNNNPSRNLTLAQTFLPIFTCPSDIKEKNRTDGQVINSATSSYKACGTPYDGWAGGAVGTMPNRARFSGMFDRDNRPNLRMTELVDGTSNQFMIAEAKWGMDNGGRNRGRIFGATDQNDGAVGASNALMLNGQWQMNWTQPKGNPQPHRTAASNHPGGAQFCLADGSVRFVSQNIQHTATAWVNDAQAFMTPQNQPFGLYQRLFAIWDSHPITEY